MTAVEGENPWQIPWIPQEIKEGIIPVEKRKPIGMGATYNDALDPLALQLAFVGIVYEYEWKSVK